MLPGYVSGFYTYDDCHIDLVRLAQFCNTRLIHTHATGIDLAAQEVLLHDRPPLPYDVLSINIGIAPSMSQIPGADKYTVPVKPISTFSLRFEAMLKESLLSSEEYRVAVVGGGPSGIELACAVNYRLTEERKKAGIKAPVRVSLVSRGQILTVLAPYARRAFLPLLKERNIELYETQGGVISVDAAALTLGDGTMVPFDVCLWCTQAGAAGWLGESALPTDERGFLRVNEYLQADGGPENVFGAGDCITNVSQPRPKAGVYAVRAVSSLSTTFYNFIILFSKQIDVMWCFILNYWFMYIEFTYILEIL